MDSTSSKGAAAPAHGHAHEAEGLYQCLVEHGASVVWSGTHDGHYMYVSDNVARVTGYDFADIREGRHGAWLERVHPSDVERVRGAYRALAACGTDIDIEYRWQHRDGRWLWIHLRAIRTATGVDGVFSDITARRGALTVVDPSVVRAFEDTLTAIGLNGTLLVEALGAHHPARDVVVDLLTAVQRGGEISRRLCSGKPDPER